MIPLGGRGAMRGPLGASPVSLASAWYLAGGITAANCLAAYTPKGAASLAASYDNNAAPGNGLPDGTYDCTLGVAPTWDVANGWIFSGATQYLKTGITPATGWSMFVRFTDAAVNANRMAGGRGLPTATTEMSLIPSYGGSVYYFNGGQLAVAGAITAGTLCVSGNQGYKDGLAHGGAIPAWSGTGGEIFVGCLGDSGTPIAFKMSKIQYLSIYNTAITAAQVLALHNATV